MIKLNFKVESFRRIPSPYGMDRDENKPQSTYFAICNIKNLPDKIPMETNPREQKLTTKVPKKIKHSLLYNQDENFHLLNRGLVISAQSVHFNNDTNMLSIVFTDLEKHGDVDGGHTYKIILENRHEIEDNRFVRLEILTGVEDYFEDLADARNTSTQVQDKSLAELANKFDIIKTGIKNESFFNDVAYKENADGNIDISDIVAILTMFNIDRYSSNTHPVSAYSSKSKCVTNYLEDYDNNDKVNPFIKMQDIMPDIFKLYSMVEQQLPETYNGNGGKKYGRTKGVVYKNGRAFHKLKFSPDKKPICYESPRGFIYPLVAAFRALVQENKTTGKYEWGLNIKPSELFDEVKEDLIVTTVERSRSLGNNPQSVGKDSGHWAQMYQNVENRIFKKQINLLSK